MRIVTAVFLFAVMACGAWNAVPDFAVGYGEVEGLPPDGKERNSWNVALKWNALTDEQRGGLRRVYPVAVSPPGFLRPGAVEAVSAVRSIEELTASLEQHYRLDEHSPSGRGYDDAVALAVVIFALHQLREKR